MYSTLEAPAAARVYRRPMDHTIHRLEHRRRFTIIDNAYLSDPTLSWRAKGILTYLLSKPDDWQVMMCDLEERSTDGEVSTRSGVHELIEAGYMWRDRIHDAKGRIIGWRTLVFESPQSTPGSITPQGVYPDRGFPDLGDVGQLKTDPPRTDRDLFLVDLEEEDLEREEWDPSDEEVEDLLTKPEDGVSEVPVEESEGSESPELPGRDPEGISLEIVEDPPDRESAQLFDNEQSGSELPEEVWRGIRELGIRVDQRFRGQVRAFSIAVIREQIRRQRECKTRIRYPAVWFVNGCKTLQAEEMKIQRVPDAVVTAQLLRRQQVERSDPPPGFWEQIRSMLRGRSASPTS